MGIPADVHVYVTNRYLWESEHEINNNIEKILIKEINVTIIVKVDSNKVKRKENSLLLSDGKPATGLHHTVPDYRHRGILQNVAPSIRTCLL